jgi:hypothetical protein
MNRKVLPASDAPVSGSAIPDISPPAANAEASAAPAEETPRKSPGSLRRKRINGRVVTAFRTLGALTAREKHHLVSEILQVRGLMPLLMKPRNGQRWTSEDKVELGKHLRRLSKLSPYLLIGVMPGGFLLLPALAWWLDRRRNRSASRRTTEP